MVNLTHLVFNDRLQDRKARKKITVKYIILNIHTHLSIILRQMLSYCIQTQGNLEVELNSNHDVALMHQIFLALIQANLTK